MKIYFDTCSLNRPLDDKTQLRAALEAEAVLGLLALCESGTETLVSSEVAALENERNPLPQRKAFVAAILEGSTSVVMIDEEIKQRAEELQRRGGVAGVGATYGSETLDRALDRGFLRYAQSSPGHPSVKAGWSLRC